MNDAIGHVKECHQPGNDLCPHNADIKFNCDCVSNKVVIRKPYRVVRVDDPTVTNHKFSGRLVATIHPNGLLGLRELGKRKEYTIQLGTVYERLVWREAMILAQAKKAARKNRGRKGRK